MEQSALREPSPETGAGRTVARNHSGPIGRVFPPLLVFSSSSPDLLTLGVPPEPPVPWGPVEEGGWQSGSPRASSARIQVCFFFFLNTITFVVLHSQHFETLTETPEIVLGSRIVCVLRIQADRLRTGSRFQRLLARSVRWLKAKDAAVPPFLVLCPAEGKPTREGDRGSPNAEKEDSRDRERRVGSGGGGPYPCLCIRPDGGLGHLLKPGTSCLRDPICPHHVGSRLQGRHALVYQRATRFTVRHTRCARGRSALLSRHFCFTVTEGEAWACPPLLCKPWDTGASMPVNVGCKEGISVP